MVGERQGLGATEGLRRDPIKALTREADAFGTVGHAEVK